MVQSKLGASCTMSHYVRRSLPTPAATPICMFVCVCICDMLCIIRESEHIRAYRPQGGAGRYCVGGRHSGCFQRRAPRKHCAPLNRAETRRSAQPKPSYGAARRPARAHGECDVNIRCTYWGAVLCRIAILYCANRSSCNSTHRCSLSSSVLACETKVPELSRWSCCNIPQRNTICI